MYSLRNAAPVHHAGRPCGSCGRARRSAIVVAAASNPKSLKLWYFELPGRAECTRAMLTAGKVPFEDVRFPRDQWSSIKPNMPFGQVPVLEVDGKKLAQTSAIERYVAQLAGFYPAEIWEAAKVDEAVALSREFMEIFIPTFSIKDQEQKLKARADIVQGPLKAKLTKISELIESSPTGWLTGSKGPTYADFSLYTHLSNLVGGFFDGVPTDLLSQYPTLQKSHDKIASMEPIKSYYANAVGLHASFKPLATAG